jgi:putative restriction endonuclease
MTIFNRELLHYFLENALKGYSENFQILDSANPVKFKLNDKLFSAHISYIHDSGENRDNEDEARIQIQRATLDKQKENQRIGYQPLFLGFFLGGEVFCAWDPEHVISMNFERVGSVYSRKSFNTIAKQMGGALRRFQSQSLKRNVSIIAIPSEFLGVYAENFELFHKIETEAELRYITQSHPEFVNLDTSYSTERVDYEISVGGSRERVEIVTTRFAYPRDRKFSESVLNAYGYSCAICNKQLGIVEAAHIIPHSHQDSVDSVNNGIALCVEHHKHYDQALLMPNISNKLLVNHEKVEFLIAINRDNGIDSILELENSPYTLPIKLEHYPNEQYLELGIKIRLNQSN